MASIIEIADEEDYSGLNEEVNNAKEPKESISIIKKIRGASQKRKRNENGVKVA